MIPPEKTLKNLENMTKMFIRSAISLNAFLGKSNTLDGSSLDLTKTAQAYMGFLNVAAIFIWLK